LQHCRIFRTAHFSHHPRSKAINMSANCATWTSERIELLKRCLYAGLSCGQTAREIGVTRNAVIGKMNRLGLSRPKDVIGRQLEQRRAARLARPKTPRTWRSKSPRLNIFAQHEMLMVTFRRPQPPAEDIPIYNGRGCTLLELSQGKCRWPISNPGLASIEASAHPPKTDYLFYVTTPGACGKLTFAETEAEFEEAVDDYNSAREAAGGNSPDSCEE